MKIEKVEDEKIEIKKLEDEELDDDELDDEESENDELEDDELDDESADDEEFEIEELEDFLPIATDYDEGTACMATVLKIISAGEAFEFQQKVEELKKEYGVTELELCPFEREKELPSIVEKLEKKHDKYLEFLENETFEGFLKRTRTENLIP